MGEYYRHQIPDLQLSIERNTENAPDDGSYYVLRAGSVIGRYRSLKKAEEAFREVVKISGFKPQTKAEGAKTTTELDIERYMDAKDLYWGESHKFRGGGGRGGRGGV